MPNLAKIKVGDKEFGPDEIQALLKKLEEQGLQVNSLNDKIGAFEPFSKAIDRYDTDAGTYIQHAEGAIAMASKLIEDGVIDNKGNVLVKDQGGKGSEGQGAGFGGGGAGGGEGAGGQSVEDILKTLQGTGEGNTSQLTGTEKIAAIVAKGLEPSMTEFRTKFKSMEETQGRLMQMELERKVRKQFPNLDSDDMERLFDVAYSDKTKSLTQHAEEVSKRKGEKVANMRKQVAEEMGIDLEAYEKKLVEKKALSDEGLGGMVKGKKLSFTPDKKAEDQASPLSATLDFLNRQEA